MTEGQLMDMRLLAAEAIARSAPARALIFDRSLIGFKGPQDFLTEVDGETEAFIAERLLAFFPGDGFLGEESRRPLAEAARDMVVDPIDGTANLRAASCSIFARRSPASSVFAWPSSRHLRSNARRIVRWPTRQALAQRR